MRVLIDGESFFRHTRSGITRYFTELIRGFETERMLGVLPTTPYRFVASQHLASAFPSRFRQVSLPRRVRPCAFSALNSRAWSRRSTKVDLIHHSLYLPALLEHAPSVPRICTIFDFTLELYSEQFPWSAPLVEQKNAVISRCDGVVCISRATYDDMSRFLPGFDKPIEITPLGVTEQFFKPVGRRPTNLPARYVLHVGNRHAHKNAGVLFSAFAHIADREPELFLVLCGNPLTATERQQLKNLRIAARTLYLRVSDEQLPHLYAQAAAFVFPSRYEGFGLPVVEAMAAGCPVVCSSAPALVEVADDAALIFAADDSEELAAILEKVLGDRGLVASLRAKGRARAEVYSWRRTVQLTARAYRRVVGEA